MSESLSCSSGDAMRSLTARLQAELGMEVWQEHGCPHVSAIYLRCTSSACWLSSMYPLAIIMAWVLVGNRLMNGYNFMCRLSPHMIRKERSD